MTSERLGRIINLKSLTKEQLEAEAKQTREELRIEKEKLERLENLLAETMKKYTDSQEPGVLNQGKINLFHDYIIHIEEKLRKQKRVVQKKREILMGKEKELTKAYREKRLLEILQDNTFKEEIRESLIKEQKEMDLEFIMRRLRV